MQASQDSNGGGVTRQKSTELDAGEATPSSDNTGTRPSTQTTDTKKFFAGLLGNPSGGVSGGPDSTPTHGRAPSQQVTSMNSAVPERTAGRLTTAGPSSTTGTSSTTIKPTKAEKLMEMLKK